MAENILETIAAKRRIYIEEKKKQVPLKNLISQAEALLQKEEAGEVSAKPSFYDSLAGDKLSFICEVKKASPSKGLIAPEFPYLPLLICLVPFCMSFLNLSIIRLLYLFK